MMPSRKHTLCDLVSIINYLLNICQVKVTTLSEQTVLMSLLLCHFISFFINTNIFKSLLEFFYNFNIQSLNLCICKLPLQKFFKEIPNLSCAKMFLCIHLFISKLSSKTKKFQDIKRFKMDKNELILHTV